MKAEYRVNQGKATIYYLEEAATLLMVSVDEKTLYNHKIKTEELVYNHNWTSL